MPATTIDTPGPGPKASPRPQVVVCGADGTRSSAVAVEQAATIAAGGPLTLVAVSHVRGSGPTAMADLDPHHADRVLEDAVRLLRGRGVPAASQVLHSADTEAALIKRSATADLLVVGAPVSGRGAGIALGSTATVLLHRSVVPVLVARRPPADVTFPRRILLATDGSSGSEHAVDLVAAVAAGRDAQVLMLHAGAPASDVATRRMAEQAVRVREATGSEPVWLEATGDPVAAIVAAARANRSALVVVGARGLSGVRALGSVSERVAHEAPCSVLVARS